MPVWHRAKWHTREQVQRAVDYYTVHYARDIPRVLATEIHRCRAMVVDMLTRVNPRCTGLLRCISDAHPELGEQLVSAGHVQPLAHPGYSPDLAEADVP